MNKNKKFAVNLENVEIKIESVKAGSSVMARAVIILDGTLEVRGFKILKSKFKESSYIVKPPSYKGGGIKWVNIFRVHDNEVWESISKKILDEYEIDKDLEIEEEISIE